jgi:hypothetical protein
MYKPNIDARSRTAAEFGLRTRGEKNYWPPSKGATGKNLLLNRKDSELQSGLGVVWKR